MELAELVKQYRSEPRRTWNFASSSHWYDGDDFWLDMITNDPIYRGAMIETEAQMIAKICASVAGERQQGIFVALGPGDGVKELQLREALGTPLYVPIDINKTELALAAKTATGAVRPIHAEFRDGLSKVKDEHPKFIYLGSTYSNLDAFEYDLLAVIDNSLKPGDAFYVSVQTCPEHKDLALILSQYENLHYTQLTERLTGQAGITIGKEFSQFNPVTSNLEVAASVATVSGAAEEVGVKPGDTVVTMISHKPQALKTELAIRFGERYDIRTYQTQHVVDVRGMQYTSHFEGAILTKKA